METIDELRMALQTARSDRHLTVGDVADVAGIRIEGLWAVLEGVRPDDAGISATQLAHLVDVLDGSPALEAAAVALVTGRPIPIGPAPGR